MLKLVRGCLTIGSLEYAESKYCWLPAVQSLCLWIGWLPVMGSLANIANELLKQFGANQSLCKFFLCVTQGHAHYTQYFGAWLTAG